MKIHEARIDEERHQSGAPLEAAHGMVSRILNTHPAWSVIGVDAIVKALQDGQMALVDGDINSTPSALHAWLSSCPSMMTRSMHDSWFPPLRQISHKIDEQHVDQMETLLEQAGCDPFARDTNGVDCIDLACLHGRYNSLKRWHAKGLDLNIDSRRMFLPNTDQGQWYGPMHIAATAGSVEQMSALVDAGADPNLPDSTGKTPLFHAKDATAAKWLLDNGANPACVDHQGMDARAWWQSGIWRGQKMDELVSCLPASTLSLTGGDAVPAFVAMAYRQPTTRLKAEISRMKVGYDATHDGHGLLGHAALRIIGHAGVRGSAAERWMEWLLEKKPARNAVSDVDLGLLCLIHRVSPDASDANEGEPAQRVLAMARKSPLGVARCVLAALEKYPASAPTYLLKQARYLEKFIADGSPACTKVVNFAFSRLASHHTTNPPLSFRWFVEKVDMYPDNPAWRTPQALESLFILAKDHAATSPASPTGTSNPAAIKLGMAATAFNRMLESGARHPDKSALHEKIMDFVDRLTRDGDRAQEMGQALMAGYNASLLQEAVPQALAPSSSPRF